VASWDPGVPQALLLLLADLQVAALLLFFRSSSSILHVVCNLPFSVYSVYTETEPKEPILNTFGTESLEELIGRVLEEPNLSGYQGTEPIGSVVPNAHGELKTTLTGGCHASLE
jgi:hypothetical protein